MAMPSRDALPCCGWSRRRWLAHTAGVLAAPLPLAVSASPAPRFPAGPVTLVVPFPPGGVNDVLARELSQRLGAIWQVAVLVENRAGGGTVIGSDQVARARADGQTLLLTSMAHATLRAFYPQVPFDPAGAFAPVALLAAAPFVLVVREGLGPRDWAAFLALSQRRQDLSYSSTGIGGSSHLITELLRSRLRQSWLHVPYKGASPAVADVAGGQVDFTLAAYNTVAPFLANGRLRALAVTSGQRLPRLAQVPTLAECGVREFDAGPWWGVAAPVATPEPVLAQLRQDVRGVMRSPAVRETLQSRGMTPLDVDAAGYRAHFERESRRWQAVIAQAGIRAE